MAAKIEAGKVSPGEITMTLVISDGLVKASGFSENELYRVYYMNRNSLA
jgi:hypothetical protein